MEVSRSSQETSFSCCSWRGPAVGNIRTVGSRAVSAGLLQRNGWIGKQGVEAWHRGGGRGVVGYIFVLPDAESQWACFKIDTTCVVVCGCILWRGARCVLLDVRPKVVGPSSGATNWCHERHARQPKFPGVIVDIWSCKVVSPASLRRLKIRALASTWSPLFSQPQKLLHRQSCHDFSL